MSAGFQASARVCATTHEAVLSAVVAKLRTEIAELSSESACFLSDTASPGVEIHENLFCTVSPASSTFEDRPPVGAADQGIVEVALIQVTLWSRMLLDRLDHSVRSLTDNSRGLLKYKHRILQSLAGSQLYLDAPDNSVPLLIDYLQPTQALHPHSSKITDDLRSFTVVFKARFYWDLVT